MELSQVILIGNYGPDRQYSMQLFLQMLREGIEGHGVPVQALMPQPHFRREGTTGPWAKWLGYLDKYLRFPGQLSKALACPPNGTVIHVCDHSNAVYEPRIRRFPRLVTCHDLLAVRSALGEFPGQRPGWTGRRLQGWIRSSLGRFRDIACDSEATLGDVRRLLHPRAARLEVVPVGMNRPFAPIPQPRAWEWLRNNRVLPSRVKRYILHVGGNQWYKNRRGVVEIFNRFCPLQNDPDVHLVLAGKKPDAGLLAVLSQSPFQARVLKVEDFRDEDLPALYSAADCLLFPSLAEGFGWPVVEALACGCPVVTSDRPPMKDLAGPHGILIPPHQPDVSAKILHDSWSTLMDHRERWIRHGPEWTRPFEASRMVSRYMELYRGVLERWEST